MPPTVTLFLLLLRKMNGCNSNGCSMANKRTVGYSTCRGQSSYAHYNHHQQGIDYDSSYLPCWILCKTTSLRLLLDVHHGMRLKSSLHDSLPCRLPLEVTFLQGHKQIDMFRADLSPRPDQVSSRKEVYPGHATHLPNYLFIGSIRSVRVRLLSGTNRKWLVG